MNPNTLLLPTVWPRVAPTTVNRCLLLALLAHVWLVLTLGNAPGGTAAPGEGVWGAVNVTLRGPEAPGAAESPRPPEPAVATGPVGVAETPRWGGAVRAQSAPEVPAEAGAAQLGHWAPLPSAAAPEPALTPLARTPPTVPQPPWPAGRLTEPDRVLEERLAAPVPLPTGVEKPVAMPTPVPLPTPAPPKPLPAPPIERQLASALARPNAASATPQAAQTLALPLAAAAPVLAPLPELDAPRAAPLMAPRVAPPPTAAPVAALPSLETRALPLAVTEPAVPMMKSLAAAAPSVAPPISPSVMPSVAAPVTAAMTPSVMPPSTPTAMPPAVSTALPANPVTASLSAAGAPPGASDAGTRLGHDVAGAPARPASAPPRLNLQLARPRGGELSRGGLGGGMLAVMPRPPEVDDKLGRQIAKTAKADCRTAYAGAGLLAVVPLVVETVRKDSGCKW